MLLKRSLEEVPTTPCAKARKALLQDTMF